MVAMAKQPKPDGRSNRKRAYSIKEMEDLNSELLSQLKRVSDVIHECRKHGFDEIEIDGYAQQKRGVLLIANFAAQAERGLSNARLGE